MAGLYEEGRSEPVEIDLKIVHLTDSAVLLSDDSLEEWCPLSLIEDGDQITRKDIGRTKSLTIESWVLIDKGWI